MSKNIKYTNRFNFRGQSSLALMIVITLVIVSISFSVGSVAYNQYRTIAGSIDEAQAFLLADSGAEIALLELYRDSEYAGATLGTPESNIDISMTDIGNDQFELKSVTTVGGYRREINIILDAQSVATGTGHSLTTVSVYAGDDVRLSGSDALMIGDMRTNDGIEVWNNAVLQGDAYGRSGVTRIYNGARVEDNPNTLETVEGNVYSTETTNLFNSSVVDGDVVSATAINIGSGAVVGGDQTVDPSLVVDAVPVPTFDFAEAEALAVANGTYFDFAWQFYNYLNLNDVQSVDGVSTYVMDGMYYIGSNERITLDSSRQYIITGSIVSEDGDIDLSPRGDYYVHYPQSNYPLLVAGDDLVMTNPKNTTEVDLYGVVFAVGSADFDHSNYSQTIRDQGTIIDGAAWAGDEVRIKNKVQLKLNETYTSSVQGFDFSIEAGIWYNTSWEYRSSIAVPAASVSGSTDLVDFPLLVSVTLSDLATYAQPDGDDILFTATDGTTKLNHEIEYYNSATGTLIAWVRIPALLANADNFFYMYYGNPSVPNQQSVTSTWNSNFAMVHHLEETTTGSTDIKDSTSNNNDSIAVNISGVGSNVAANGQIGGGIQLDGANDDIDIADSASQTLQSAYTLQAWVNFDVLTGSGLAQFMTKNHGSSPWERYNFGVKKGDKEVFMADSNTAGTYFYSANLFPISIGNWYQVSAVKQSNGYMIVYVNGNVASINDRTFSGSDFNANGRLYIGSYDGTDDYFNGYLDEIRIVNTARSADWIKTEFANQNNPSSFMSVNPAQSYTSATATTYNLSSWYVE